MQTTPDKADPHLPHALRILAREIHCEDGIATQCIREAADEIDRLREAIRRLAEQDAPLSAQGCNVTVPMDAAPTEDPMAYLAFAVDGSESCAVYVTDGEAQAAADAWGWQVMPLYLAARLTDAEREAVRFCVTASLPETQKLGGVAGELCRMHAATLRGLLERIGGGE